MKNMRVSQKLLFSFLIVIVMSVLVGGAGILGMYKISTADRELYNEELVAIALMGEIREELQRQRNITRDYALHAGNAEDIQSLDKSLAASETIMVNSMSAYEELITDPALETEYYNAKSVYEKEYYNLKIALRDAAYKNDGSVIDVLYDPVSTGYVNAMVSGFTASVESNNKWAKEKVDANAALFVTMTVVEAGTLVIAVIIALFFAIYISKLISTPLLFIKNFLYEMGSRGRVNFSEEEYRQAGILAEAKDEAGQSIQMLINTGKHLEIVGKHLETIAAGDLTDDMKLLSDADTIGLSMQNMMKNLNGMFSEINVATNQVSTGSKQIADGAQALAQGSTEQAAAVQQLSSSIAEIAQKTKENAEMAENAAALAKTIKGNAEKGSLQMNEMTTAVKEINEASQSINKVIKVIDDIAFQTNILALNAAVEAARAGQHGKGFAVVAEEVRNLAAKSAEAAKDTSGLIANSMDKAELGARIANDTAASLAEIVLGINESTQLVSEISRSSDEQSAGIAQINTGIDQVAQVVQQNSATAQESAAASEEMSGQSDTLQSLVARFKIKNSMSSSFSELPLARKHASQTTPSALKAYSSDEGHLDYGKY